MSGADGRPTIKILHVIHRYPPATGGSEKYFEEISRRLVQKGHEVHVWTTDADELEAFWTRDKKKIPVLQEVLNGVHVHRFKTIVLPQHPRVQRVLCWTPSTTIRRLFHFPSPLVPGMTWKAKTTGGFDLVHATALPYTSILSAAWSAARKSRCPLVITPFMHVGEVDKNDVRKWYARPDQIEVLNAAKMVIVQTDVERNFLVSCGVDIEKCFKLGVGVNPEEITPELPSNHHNPYADLAPYVYTLGSKSIDKGTVTVIEAMKEVWESHPEVKLVCVGDSMNDFEQYWQTVPVSVRKNVLMKARIPENEKIDLIEHGLLYLNPSRTDSFGITFLEAWLWEKPVIGARAGGVVEVIDDGQDGFLIDFGNTSQLAQKIEELLENPDLRDSMGVRGRQKTLHQFTWDKIFDQLYEKLEKWL